MQPIQTHKRSKKMFYGEADHKKLQKITTWLHRTGYWPIPEPLYPAPVIPEYEDSWKTLIYGRKWLSPGFLEGFATLPNEVHHQIFTWMFLTRDSGSGHPPLRSLSPYSALLNKRSSFPRGILKVQRFTEIEWHSIEVFMETLAMSEGRYICRRFIWEAYEDQPRSILDDFVDWLYGKVIFRMEGTHEFPSRHRRTTFSYKWIPPPSYLHARLQNIEIRWDVSLRRRDFHRFLELCSLIKTDFINVWWIMIGLGFYFYGIDFPRFVRSGRGLGTVAAIRELKSIAEVEVVWEAERFAHPMHYEAYQRDLMAMVDAPLSLGTYGGALAIVQEWEKAEEAEGAVMDFGLRDLFGSYDV